MKFSPKNPPREYEAGFEHKVRIKDCGDLELEGDEQITFKTSSGNEYDVTRKSWGFYATPSMNGRLKDFKLRAVLAKNRLDRYFVLLVEEGHEKDFEEYIKLEKMEIVLWMDETEELQSKFKTDSI